MGHIFININFINNACMHALHHILCQETWPTWDHLFTMSYDHVSDNAISVIKLDLFSWYREHVGNLSDVKMVVAPAASRKVLANADLAVGQLLLSPMSPNVNIAKDANVKVPTSAVGLGVVMTHPQTGFACHGFVSPPRFDTGVCTATLTTGHPASKKPSEYMVPFWVVRTTSDRTKANTCLRVEQRNAMAQEHSVAYDLPVMVNSAPIKSGEEILLYKNDKEQRKYMVPKPSPKPAARAPPAAKGPAAKKPKRA